VLPLLIWLWCVCATVFVVLVVLFDETVEILVGGIVLLNVSAAVIGAKAKRRR
jgi:hypothetical protein